MSDTIVHLNGEFLPIEQAKVSVLDRGFLFGDGVYEVIPVYGGHLFRLDQHLHRLEHSLAAIRLHNPHSHDRWRDILNDLVQRNGGGDQSLYLQITRGVAPRLLAFPADNAPTVFAMSTTLQVRIDENLRSEAESVLEQIGIDMPSAVRLFLTQVVNTRQIPFELKARRFVIEEVEVSPKVQARMDAVGAAWSKAKAKAGA